MQIDIILILTHYFLYCNTYPLSYVIIYNTIFLLPIIIFILLQFPSILYHVYYHSSPQPIAIVIVLFTMLLYI